MRTKLTRAKHLSSSFAFSRWFSSNGYLYLGKGAAGQSKLGISNLWIAFECVHDNAPSSSKIMKHFIDWLKHLLTECSAMKAAFEGHDRNGWTTRRFVVHRWFQFFFAESFALTMFIRMPNTDCFEGVFIRTRTAHHGLNMLETFRSNL